LAIVLFAGLASTHAAGKVLDLDVDTFDAAIEEHAHIMIEFHAPWCQFCQRVAPEYEAAAEKLGAMKWDGVLARVDGSPDNKVMAALKHRVKTRSFPTFRMFVHGAWAHPDDISAHATSEDIVAYCKQFTGQIPWVDLLDKAAVDAHIKQHDGNAAVIGFFPDSQHGAFEGYKHAAFARSKTGKPGAFGICRDAALAKEIVDGPTPYVALFQEGQEPEILGDQQLESGKVDIADWALLRFTPQLLEYSAKDIVSCPLHSSLPPT
jgi:thiol-disulfide isomerase/thioredoxin